jgi:hypothetical protein
MTMFSDIRIWNEAAGTSPLIPPVLQPAAFALHQAGKGRPNVEDRIQQSCFLYSSVDLHLQSLAYFCKKQLQETHEEGGRPENKPNVTLFLIGRNVYPIFTSVNAFIITSKALLDNSVALASAGLRFGQISASIRSVCDPGGKSEVTALERFRERAGQRVSGIYADSWSWAAELTAHRDLLTHFNPLSSNLAVELASSNGEIFDILRVSLPKNPESAKGYGSKLEYGVNAVSYCRDIHSRIGKFITDLMFALAERIKVMA